MFLIIGADQFLKYIIRHWGGFYICNDGISFGIHLPIFFFWLTTALFFIVLMFLIKRADTSIHFRSRSFCAAGVIIFMAGVFSNLFDRLTLGCVVDYLNLFPGLFPVFNLADINIFFGGILIASSLFHKKTNCPGA